MVELRVSPVYEAMAFNAAGTTVAAADSQGNCWIWRAATAEVLRHEMLTGERAQSLAFAADSDDLLLGTRSGMVWKWSERDFRRIVDAPRPAITKVLWLDAERFLVACEDGFLYTHSLTDGALLHALEVAPSDQAYARAVRAVAVDPRRQRIAASTHGGRVALWDLSGHRLLQELGGPGQRVRSMAFSVDGAILAAGDSDGGITLWNLENGSREELRGHSDIVLCCAFDEAGHLATGGADRVVRTWDVARGVPVSELHGLYGWIMSLAFRRPDELVAGDGDGVTAVWRTASASLVARQRLVDPRLPGQGSAFSEMAAESWRAVASRYDWPQLRCGCSRGARHVPDDFAILVHAQTEEQASGRGLTNDVEVQSMLFESAVPVSAMIVAALRDQDLAQPARDRMFRLLNAAVNGESSDVEVRLGREDLEIECREAAAGCVALCLAEISEHGLEESADHAREILEAYDIETGCA